MTTKIQLTDTQRQVLDYAANQTEGRITWYPEGVRGGARQKVITGLFNKALITLNGNDEWFVAAEGYDALGRPRPTPILANSEPEAEVDESKPERPRRARENTKQAAVIQMLQRPEGATIQQMMDATGWQAHTVRGTIAGALKKKLALNVISDKAEAGERIYRIG